MMKAAIIILGLSAMGMAAPIGTHIPSHPSLKLMS